MTLDDERRQFLEAELSQVEEKRKHLDSTIAYLRGELGRSPEDSEAESTATEATQPGTLAPNAHPKTIVNPGQFYGQSITKSARRLLEIVGKERPLKTVELYQALSVGGVEMKDQQVLYRSLFRSNKFKRVGKSLWGLTEWYPPSALKDKGDNADNGVEDDADNGQAAEVSEDEEVE